MTSKLAVDTNIIVYLRSTDYPEKSRKANELLDHSPVVSVQVVSEYLNVTKRLFKYPKQKIMEICLADLDGCLIQPVTYATLQRAKNLIDRYDFQIFDGIVVASALEAGCNTLYSEDLQHGLMVEKQLKIVNPFI
ncbi:ribonuclease VapC [Bacteroidia bacterium]|nr:ribonuclease VapC [Bacteroidia bacterium]